MKKFAQGTISAMAGKSKKTPTRSKPGLSATQFYGPGADCVGNNESPPTGSDQILFKQNALSESEHGPLRRDALLGAAAQIGQLLLSAKDPGQVIDTAMQLLGEASGQDRACYFERHFTQAQDEILVSMRNEWVRSGISREIDNPLMQNLPLSAAAPIAYSFLCRGKSFNSNIRDIPADKQYLLEGQNIFSLFLMPIMIEGVFQGFLGLDNCTREYLWTQSESSVLNIVASSIGAALSRFRAEAALKESEARFRAISERSHTAICVINDQGRITWCNDRLVEMGGYSREMVLSTPSFVAFMAPESVPFTVENFTRALMGQPYAHQYRFFFVRSDGQKRVCEKYMMDYVDTDGRRNVIVNMTDITDHLTAENEKNKLAGQLQHAQKMESVGRLAGGVAHDFNNMLGVIIGNIGLALEDLPSDSPIRENLEEVEKCANRSANLTRQLLAFARKQTIEPRILNLNETVSGMFKLLRRLIGEDIDLVWLPGNDLWPVFIDPSQIDQILANLCVNARDSIGDTGKIIIETENVNMDQNSCAKEPGLVPGAYVKLTITDNGCGMDREILSHLFEPFFTTKEQGKGTGLGLATIYGAVKQNNGFIYVNSEPGIGTAFKIYLPRHLATIKAKKTSAARKVEVHGDETILVVEDEPAILRMTTMVLQKYGYKVLGAGTIAEALHFAQKHSNEIQLLITDVIMPEMNGRDLAEKLETIIPRLKCLFMSGYTADVIAHHGVLNTGINFIQKPFSLKDLTTKIRRVIESPGS